MAQDRPKESRRRRTHTTRRAREVVMMSTRLPQVLPQANKLGREGVQG